MTTKLLRTLHRKSKRVPLFWSQTGLKKTQHRIRPTLQQQPAAAAVSALMKNRQAEEEDGRSGNEAIQSARDACVQ